MLHDLKAACRELVKNRWFTVVTVMTLALGIGANTAIFGVVNRLLLNPLPYADSEHLVYLRVGNERLQFGWAPRSVAVAWSEQARSLEAVEGYSFYTSLAYDESGARVLRGARITLGLPALLGVAPVLGRGFTAADAEAGAPPVVMLSYEIWQRDYGGAPSVLGRALTFDDVLYVVVGVMQPRWDAFTGGFRPEVIFPQSLQRAVSIDGFPALEVLARRSPNVSVDALKVELDAILERTLAEAPLPIFGEEKVSTRINAQPRDVAASTRDALLVLLGAVGLVLLVACSNVANLLLARGASRARELSLRSALGASTWRLARALLAECVVLALAAGVAGGALGWLTLRIIVRLRPANLETLDEVQLDATVLAFTFAVAVATAVLFGIAPLLQLTTRKLGDALRHGASGVVRGGAGPRLRKLLVAAQMALSVVLLVSAGLLVRSVIYLQSVDVGFDTNGLFTAQLTLPRGRYQEVASREVFLEQLVGRLRASVGIAGVTQAIVGPPNYAMVAGTDLEIRGVTLSKADAQAARPLNMVRPDFFATLGIRLLEGRTFTADEASRNEAILVSRAAAERFWPDGGALGGEVNWGGTWRTVVGITDDVVSGGLTVTRRDTPMFYLPIRETRLPPGASPPNLTFILRANGDPGVAMASLRATVRELDPEIAIPNVELTETALAGSIAGPRFNMALLIAFAAIGLVLAAVGLAAVIGYEVTERTHEIGIRMALGARTENVRRLAMSQGLTPAFGGVVVGVIGAFAATQLVASMLYGITPRDPLTFAGVVALLLLVALGASWLPARRATHVDPIIALRAE
jgi:putative ABC transport system permease protein